MPKVLKKLLFSLAFLFLFAVPASAATYTVTKTEDTNDNVCDADCSFREAVYEANNNVGADTIEFNIPLSDPNYNTSSYPNQFRIHLTVANIILSEEVAIDGNSQALNTGDTKVAVSEPSTMPVIGNSTRGPEIAFTSGLGTAPLFQITGTNVTLDRLGFYDLGTTQRRAIQLTTAGTGVTITNCDFIGNQRGVIHNSGYPNTVTITYNVFRNNSGNGFDVIEDNAVNFNFSYNEFINNDNHAIALWIDNLPATGSSTISNNLFKHNAFNNTEYPATITLNTNEPITIENNIFVGNDKPYILISDRWNSGVPHIATIKNNLMTENSTRPIDLAGCGYRDCWLDIVTNNDSGDIDTGPNDLQNFPVITSVSYLGGSQYKVVGEIDGNPSEAPWTIEVCATDFNSTGNGGCSQSLGYVITYTNTWEKTVTVSGDNENTYRGFTSLATNANGSTSEFGNNFSLNLPISPITISPIPDLIAKVGGDVVKGKVLHIIPSDSIPWDVYLDVIKYPKTSPYKLPGSVYWQASDVYEVWLKSFFNHARILPEVIEKPIIFTIKYEDWDLESTLPENNLRLAYSEDEGVTWKILNNSVLDSVNNTVSIVTKQGGHYMLVSGWPY